jgi:hypothetical protein
MTTIRKTAFVLATLATVIFAMKISIYQGHIVAGFFSISTVGFVAYSLILALSFKEQDQKTRGTN